MMTASLCPVYMQQVKWPVSAEVECTAIGLWKGRSWEVVYFQAGRRAGPLHRTSPDHRIVPDIPLISHAAQARSPADFKIQRPQSGIIIKELARYRADLRSVDAAMGAFFEH